MSVRVRFAPSPTGLLHVGGLRTALYNYLFARRHGGVMVLRIEDTDQTRFVEGAEDNIIAMSDWAGVRYDEGPTQGGNYGPYRQSERLSMYAQYAYELCEKGFAYYAFDTSEELDAMRERQQNAGIAPKYDRTVMRSEQTLGADETKRLLEEGAPYVIRLKMPHTGEIRFTDMVRGDMTVACRDVDDQILLKSDGFPTYHLANIVDDHLMEITHVIRGEEWLPSLPKHVFMYDAFGWKRPEFAHLPLLLNPDKSKLSKRQSAVAVSDYHGKGYFPEALVNFVALLGWNPTSNREIFTLEEMCELFELGRVNKAGAVFDVQKLNWMNGEYFKILDPTVLAERILPDVRALGSSVSVEYLASVVALLRDRVTLLPEILQLGDFLLHSHYAVDEEYKAKFWNADNKKHLAAVAEVLAGLADFGHASVHAAVKEYITASGAKMGPVMNTLRLATTGKSVGAGVTETLEVLGKDETVRRIAGFISAYEV